MNIIKLKLLVSNKYYCPTLLCNLQKFNYHTVSPFLNYSKLSDNRLFKHCKYKNKEMVDHNI
jgi:hypothetical protein